MKAKHDDTFLWDGELHIGQEILSAKGYDISQLFPGLIVCMSGGNEFILTEFDVYRDSWVVGEWYIA